jgi:hypothetical protein
MLVYRDADKMPHVTNPKLFVTPSLIPTSLSLVALPSIANRYVKIHSESPTPTEGELTVFNVLGEQLSTRKVELDVGANTEYFDTSAWPSGTYIAEFSANSSYNSTSKISTARLIVQH